MAKRHDLIPDSYLEVAATVLKVIAHPKRLRIHELLIQHKKLKVSDLADNMGISPNTVSQHLKLMKAHNVVDAQREGRNVYYFSTHPVADTMLKCIRKHCDRFD